MYPPDNSFPDNGERDFASPEEVFDVDESEPEAIEQIECWRCGKFVPVTLPRCPACDAALGRSIMLQSASSTDPVARRVIQVIIVSAVLLLPMLVCSAAFLMAEQAPGAEEMLQVIGTIEIIDSIIVLCVLATIRPSPLPAPEGGLSGAVMWLAALPMLVGMLAINIAYFTILTEGMGVPVLEDELMSADHLLPWIILVIGIQPAVIEEIFFRHTALLTMREAMGEKAAIWTTAVMFGFAHIGNPFGIPYLILVGVFLGYVRVRSGSLLLPMILHFLHNMAVLLYERMA